MAFRQHMQWMMCVPLTIGTKQNQTLHLGLPEGNVISNVFLPLPNRIGLKRHSAVLFI